MQLDKTLQKYGLTVKESQLYLALLELGRGTILALSKKTKIKRAGLYYTMKNLAEKGLTREAKTGKKSYWEATDPDTLLAREDEKHRLISLAMPELRAINNSVAGKPRVTYYQGFEGINRAERDLLEVAAKLPLENREILQYGSIEDIIKSPIKGAKETINYRTDHNIRLKFISPWSPAAERLSQGDEQSLRQTILLPKDISIKGVTYIVVGDRIAFYTLDKDQDPSVILIQHPEQAKIQRYLFDWAWDQLKTRHLPH